MDRAVEVNAWFESRCLYAEWTPSFAEAVAEVLTRIPESALDGLIDKGTYLVFPAVNVSFVDRITYRPGEESLSLVVLSSGLAKASRSEAIGIVAHELAHAFLGHSSGGADAANPEELAADDLARSWGFVEEIGIVNTLHPRLGSTSA